MIILKINDRFEKQSKKVECNYATCIIYCSKYAYLFLGKSSYDQLMIV